MEIRIWHYYSSYNY